MVAATPERNRRSNGSKSLYETDETAWLEQTARSLRDRRHGSIDRANLAEFLEDMALREKREIKSRLISLLAHLLKWEFQPERRSESWKQTIRNQRRELGDLLSRKTLWNFANSKLSQWFALARKDASSETGKTEGELPEQCPLTLEEVLEA